MSQTQQDDAALLAAWCEGDLDAGDRLLKSAFPRLYRFLFNKIGEDTPELIQQIMLACVEHRDKLEDCVNFEAYLLRMARNKLYDFLRKRGRDREELPGELPSVHDLGTSVASLLGRQSRELKVLSALRTLPTDLQVVLELHYWNELSMREISDVIEAPMGTVKSRMRRARVEFENILRTSDISADLIGSYRV